MLVAAALYRRRDAQRLAVLRNGAAGDLNSFPLQQFNNNPDDSNFGTIIKSTVAQGNANFPRQIQFGVKFIF